MICNVVRYQEDSNKAWGVLHEGNVYPLDLYCATTKDFLAEGAPRAYGLHKSILNSSCNVTCVPYDSLYILSPITKDKNILCQGVNYRQHMIESGMDPDAKDFNMFFHKSSTSICSATDNVLCPEFVSLLDYEVELGLVIGSEVREHKQITKNNIHEVVAGIVIGNDVSARDIQIPQMQFFKGKSYRTFCPLGPVLCLLEAEDMHYLHNLELELKVNDRVRQKDNTKNLIYKPEESLTEFTQVTDLNPGDIVLTGTPNGCAMRIPGPGLKKTIFQLLPEKKKWEMFMKIQAKSSDYLEAGDLMTATIRSSDGKIDLGLQSNTVFKVQS